MTVTIEKKGNVGVVTLNRPETKNAITQDMRQQLWEAFEDFAMDSDVRCVVLTGAGGSFCSGVDVGALGGGGVPGSMSRMHTLHRIARAIHNLKKPTIAAIPGVCVGAGWGFALCCDMIIADENAKFAQIFRNIALAPDAGSVWSLTKLVGPMRAKELCYSGRLVKAPEALELGLVMEVTKPEALQDRALEMAQSLASGPTIAYALAKRQFDFAGSSSFDQFLDAEYAMQPVASRTEDHEEGIAAFRERRPPNFKGV